MKSWQTAESGAGGPSQAHSAASRKRLRFIAKGILA
jgi:hypothetical protein